MSLHTMIDFIQWLGHGSFLIQGPPFIYIDPWRISRTTFLADVILISHTHYDHCSLADIENLRSDNTVIIGNKSVAEQIAGTTILREWQTITFDRTSIKALPAYSPQGTHHPQANGGLGFVISMNFYDIYYAGDTRITPEMQHIRPDIALLPIDGHDTLDVEEAVEAVQILKPRWVFPFNWGATGEGVTRTEALHFQRRIGDLAEVILPKSAQS